jgi:death on curing protein
MVTLQEVLAIHTEVVALYGGSDGVREKGALESAIARPFQTFGGEELYPNFYEKAAAFGESIIMNHPFVDGNKRTGYVLMETILRVNGYKIIAGDDALYEFVVGITTGEKRFSEIVEWLKDNSVRL